MTIATTSNVVKLSTKFQIVVPREVRESHGWKPGDELAFIEDESGLHLVRVPTFQELRGILKAGEITVPFEREKDFG